MLGMGLFGISILRRTLKPTCVCLMAMVPLVYEQNIQIFY